MKSDEKNVMTSRQPLPIRTDLTLEAATRIVDGALELRKRYGVLPLTVAQVRLTQILFPAEDGASAATVDEMRAQAALAASSHGRFIPVPGGVLILDDAGQVIGAVGISGDTSDRDELCAIEAVRAAGLTADLLAPQPEWQGKGA